MNADERRLKIYVCPDCEDKGSDCGTEKIEKCAKEKLPLINARHNNMNHRFTSLKYKKSTTLI